MSDLSFIKELREKTGAGFVDCRNALKDNNNDISLSIDSLRKKGLAKATKKSSREANEGAVGFYSNESISIVLKINSETDFSAKSDTFLDFLDSIGHIALNTNNKALNLAFLPSFSFLISGTLLFSLFDLGDDFFDGARASKFSRCALPITAFLVVLPSKSAI